MIYGQPLNSLFIFGGYEHIRACYLVSLYLYDFNQNLIMATEWGLQHVLWYVWVSWGHERVICDQWYHPAPLILSCYLWSSREGVLVSMAGAGTCGPVDCSVRTAGAGTGPTRDHRVVLSSLQARHWHWLESSTLLHTTIAGNTHTGTLLSPLHPDPSVPSTSNIDTRPNPIQQWHLWTLIWKTFLVTTSEANLVTQCQPL